MICSCLECHFLCVQRAGTAGLNTEQPLSRAARQALPARPVAAADLENLKCYKKIWVSQDLIHAADPKTFLTQNRLGQCYFYWFKSTLSLEAAAQGQLIAPDPPPAGYALLGERPWMIWAGCALAGLITLMVYLF